MKGDDEEPESEARARYRGVKNVRDRMQDEGGIGEVSMDESGIEGCI